MEREIILFVLIHGLVVALAILAAGGLGAAYRSVRVALASGGAVLACLNALFLVVGFAEGKIPHALCYGLPVLLIVLGLVMLHAARLHQSREKVIKERDEVRAFRAWFGRGDFVAEKLRELAVAVDYNARALEEPNKELVGLASPRSDKRAQAIVDDVTARNSNLTAAKDAFRTAHRVAFENGFSADHDWFAHLPSESEAEPEEKDGGQAPTPVPPAWTPVC
jgi:hypothetical protein